MRFEILAAYVVGIGLPLAEALRRRTNFDDIPAYVDDFLVGALLIVAARLAAKRDKRGPVLLVIAWAVLCGGLYYSFFGQLFSTNARDISGLPNGVVVAIKGALYAVALTCLVLSARTCATERNITS